MCACVHLGPGVCLRALGSWGVPAYIRVLECVPTCIRAWSVCLCALGSWGGVRVSSTLINGYWINDLGCI